MLRNDVANLFKHVAVSWCIAYTVGAFLGFLIVGLLQYIAHPSIVPRYLGSMGAWAKGSPRGSSILSHFSSRKCRICMFWVSLEITAIPTLPLLDSSPPARMSAPEDLVPRFKLERLLNQGKAPDLSPGPD